MNRAAVYLLGGFAVTAGALVFLACGFDPPEKHTPSGTSNCIVAAGEFPAPDCDKSERSCKSSGCVVEDKCNPDKICLPLADNAGKDIADFRIRWLTVMSPESLAKEFIQKAIINQAIKLKMCAEAGDGAFNWLFRLDRKQGTLITGGAPPSADPIGSGYCFYQGSTAGFPVRPETVKVTLTGNSFTTDAIPRLLIPIFNNGDLNDVIYLPLSDAKIVQTGISADSNCIGAYNPSSMDYTCSDDINLCSRWNTNGSIGGYIQLEEADTVPIALVNQSLCAILMGDPEENEDAGPMKYCAREGGHIRAKGDYCSVTKKAGECQDSMWLTATFAASAVKITDGKEVPSCQVREQPDSGVPDASLDAKTD